jgi:hypothetical protein
MNHQSYINSAIASIRDANNHGRKAAYAHVYLNGFVPNSYKWKAPGTRLVVFSDGRFRVEKYDRKRSGGIGPDMVLFSEKGGRV